QTASRCIVLNGWPPRRAKIVDVNELDTIGARKFPNLGDGDAEPTLGQHSLARDGKANWRKFLSPWRWMLWHNGCDVSRTHRNPTGPAGTALPLARRRDHPRGGIF